MLPISIVPASTDRPRQLLARRLPREPAPTAATERCTGPAVRAVTPACASPDARDLRDTPDTTTSG